MGGLAPPENLDAKLWPRLAAIAERLRQQLVTWQENVTAVRPTLQSNSLLTEDVPMVDALVSLCEAGEEALDYLSVAKQNAAADRKKHQTSQVQEAGKRHGDLLLPISPAIEALVQAVTAAP